MSVLQVFEVLRQYGADVLILAVAVTFVTALLKKTVLKKCSNKVYVFLPFVVGIVLYAAYRMAVTTSVAPLTRETVSTLEGGFRCGSVATLYYVVYEQFFRKNQRTLTLSPLLETFVPEESWAAASQELIGGKGLPNEQLSAFVETIIKKYALPALAETELALYVRLISAFLKTLKE